MIFDTIRFPVIQAPAFLPPFRLVIEIQVPVAFVFVVEESIGMFRLGLVGAVETGNGVLADDDLGGADHVYRLTTLNKTPQPSFLFKSIITSEPDLNLKQGGSRLRLLLVQFVRRRLGKRLRFDCSKRLGLRHGEFLCSHFVQSALLHLGRPLLLSRLSLFSGNGSWFGLIAIGTSLDRLGYGGPTSLALRRKGDAGRCFLEPTLRIVRISTATHQEGNTKGE